MGKSNSKPEIKYLKFGCKKRYSSHGDLVHKTNNLQAKSITNSNDDLRRTVTIGRKIRDRQIAAERLKYEKEAQARLEEHNDRMIREKQRKIDEKGGMKKHHDLVLKELVIKRERITKDPEIVHHRQYKPKEDTDFFESQKDHRNNVAHISEQAENLEESKNFRGEKKVERQLLENLLNTELAKEKCSINHNSKRINHQHKSIQDVPIFEKVTDATSNIGDTKKYVSKNEKTPNTSTQALSCKVDKNNLYNEPPPPYSSQQYSYQPNNQYDCDQPPPAYSPRDIP